MSDRHELLLDWISERADGTWHDFRQAHGWLFPDETLTIRQQRPGVAALVLASLGHMEIAWERGTWSAAPPMLTILPHAGGHALLTGGRSRALKDRLIAELDSDVRWDLVLHVRAQDDAPDAYFLAAGSEAEVESLADELGIGYDYSAADRLSRLLPTLDAVIDAASESPPAQGYETRQLRAIDHKLGWVESESDRAPGLYGYAVWGREEYRWVETPGRYLRLDKFTGIYAELRRLRRSVMLLRMDGPTGTLSVPGTAPLPALQARAAVLCSGLAPSYSRADGTRTYVNVTREIALRIASSLGQELEVTEEPERSSIADADVGRVARGPVPHLRFGSDQSAEPGPSKGRHG